MAIPTLLYSDTLVEINGDAIRFKDYYFPVGSKSVRFADIASVTAAKPNWLNGQYRIQGTGRRAPKSFLFRCVAPRAGLVSQWSPQTVSKQFCAAKTY